jgi:hypothetical protein
LRSKAPAPTAAQWNKLASLAEKCQWSDYASHASAFGCLLPMRPERPPKSKTSLSDLFLDVGSSMDDPVSLAFRQSETPSAMLDSIKAAYGPKYFAKLAQHLLDSSFDSMFSVGWAPEQAKALAAAGCDARAAASAAAHCGSLETLRAYLDAGVDPNMACEGQMAPILLALTKERAFGMSDKMACAKELYARGAQIRKIFDPQPDRPGFPLSLLELGLANSNPGISRLGSPHPAAHFDFPWNYFSESGIPIDEILPVETDFEGARRIADILSEPEHGIFDDLAAVDFAEGARRRGALDHPWLAAAFDLVALRLSLPRMGASSKPKTL